MFHFYTLHLINTDRSIDDIIRVRLDTFFRGGCVLLLNPFYLVEAGVGRWKCDKYI